MAGRRRTSRVVWLRRAVQSACLLLFIYLFLETADHPINRGTLCPKGASLIDFIHSPNRLTHPEYRAPGSDKWEPISWNDALDRIAKKPALHGEQCGVGTIRMMYLHAGTGEEVRDALLVIGAPTTAHALGVTDDEIVQALVHAHEIAKERYTILGDTGLTEEAAERLARITKVI
jgi:anaerobic selenocysteine-containing dehydrogenase